MALTFSALGPRGFNPPPRRAPALPAPVFPRVSVAPSRDQRESLEERTLRRRRQRDEDRLRDEQELQAKLATAFMREAGRDENRARDLAHRQAIRGEPYGQAGAAAQAAQGFAQAGALGRAPREAELDRELKRQLAEMETERSGMDAEGMHALADGLQEKNPNLAMYLRMKALTGQQLNTDDPVVQQILAVATTDAQRAVKDFEQSSMQEAGRAPSAEEWQHLVPFFVESHQDLARALTMPELRTVDVGVPIQVPGEPQVRPAALDRLLARLNQVAPDPGDTEQLFETARAILGHEDFADELGYTPRTLFRGASEAERGIFLNELMGLLRERQPQHEETVRAARANPTAPFVMNAPRTATVRQAAPVRQRGELDAALRAIHAVDPVTAAQIGLMDNAAEQRRAVLDWYAQRGTPVPR